MHSNITTDNFLSQRWIWDNRYLLNKDAIHAQAYDIFKENAYSRLELTELYSPTYTKGKPVAICDWLNRHVTIEPHIYDFTIPVSYVTPISFLANEKPWVLLLYTIDGYNTPRSQLNTPSIISSMYSMKEEVYMPKAFLLDCVELCWVGYDDCEDCILVHHNQINGVLKGHITPNDLIWMHRYMIRTFVQSVPLHRRSQIFVPDAYTFSLFMERKMKYTQIPMLPYTKHILQKSDFEKVPCSVFEQECPQTAAICDIFNYLDRSEIHFWRYEYGNPNTLANTCNGAR